MAIDDKIKALTKQLYPTGRVWRINPNSIKEKFVNGLLASEIRAYNDGVSILDSTIPDNPNFTEDDASAWEKRLGLPDGTGMTLQQRIDAIKVQLNWPGTNPAKGAIDYIQAVLQAAGFNVCTQENLFLGSGSSLTFFASNVLNNSIQWQSVCFGNGLFVAVGSGSSTIITSPDGINWTSTSCPLRTYTSVCFGNGLFVAVAQLSSTIITSPDGINWTSRTGAASASWTRIAFGNGIFLVVALASSIVQTSPDGITWTSHPIHNSSYFSLAFGNGIFVTIASDSTNNEIYTSPDGITWTQRSQPLLANFNSFVFGNGLFVALDNSGNGNVIISSDGINWTAHTSPTIPIGWLAMTYGAGLFIALGYQSQKIITSPDGINWTLYSTGSPQANQWLGIAFGNNTFAAIAQNGITRAEYGILSVYHKTYADFSGNGLVRHISTLLHGQQLHGPLQTNVGGGGIIIANSVDPNGDNSFDVGDYSDTIFVGGCPPGTFINIPKSQETAFRQMILKIKPVNVTVLLLVRFV